MAAPTKKSQSLTAQAFWLMIAKTLAFMFAFALPILLTRSLSQTEFGIYKQVFLVITTATALLPLGFGMSAFYYLPREKDESRRAQVVFNILLFNGLMGATAGIVLVFFPELLTKIFRDSSLAPYSSLMGATILLWLFSSFLDTLAVANQELRVATIFIVAGQLTRTILLLGAAIVFDTVEALVYAAVIHGILQSIALLWYVRSRFPAFWRKFDLSLTSNQIAYALPFGLAGLLFTIQTDLHNYFVSNQFDAATFAVYSIGVAQLPLVGILRESVSSVILPRVSYLQKQGQEREIVTLLASAIRKLSAVYLPLYAFLMLTGPEFLTVMFTSTYAASWPIFAINLTLLPLSIVEVDAVVRAYESHRFFLVKLQIVLSILMVIALWYGISSFGLVGAISVVVAINFLLRVVLAIKFGKVIGVQAQDFVLLKDVGKVALASAISGAIAALVKSQMVGSGFLPILVLTACTIAFGIVYLAAIVLLRVPTKEERDSVRRSVERLQEFIALRRSADSIS